MDAGHSWWCLSCAGLDLFLQFVNLFCVNLLQILLEPIPSKFMFCTIDNSFVMCEINFFHEVVICASCYLIEILDLYVGPVIL